MSRAEEIQRNLRMPLPARPARSRMHTGEVATVAAGRAMVIIAGATHTVSTTAFSPAAGDLVRVEFGPAIPRLSSVLTSLAAPTVPAPPSATDITGCADLAQLKAAVNDLRTTVAAMYSALLAQRHIV